MRSEFFIIAALACYFVGLFFAISGDSIAAGLSVAGMVAISAMACIPFLRKRST